MQQLQQQKIKYTHKEQTKGLFVGFFNITDVWYQCHIVITSRCMSDRGLNDSLCCQQILLHSMTAFTIIARQMIYFCIKINIMTKYSKHCGSEKKS